MAMMKRNEVSSKLRLLNRNEDFELYLDPSNNRGFFINIEPERLVLEDPAVGDYFEWVDDSHSSFKIKGETADEAIYTVKQKTDSDTLGPLSGKIPNKDVLSAVISLRNSFVLKDDKADGKECNPLGIIEGHACYIEKSNQDKYDALMALSEVLDVSRVFRDAHRDDVLELYAKAKLQTGYGKTRLPMFINKKDVHRVLRYINVLKTFSDQIELPNEFYQMVLDGTSYRMKTLPDGTTVIPEPKTASETFDQCEERLRSTMGEPTTGAGGIRTPYPHESIDYSPTVEASDSEMIDHNPSTSGVAPSTLSPAPRGSASGYYYEMKKTKTRERRPSRTEDDPFIPAERDHDLGSRIKAHFSSLSVGGVAKYLAQNKRLILGALAVVGGGILLGVAIHSGFFLTLAKLLFYTVKEIALPIPNFFLKGWGGMTILSKDLFIAEVILLIRFLGPKLVNYLKKLRKKDVQKERTIAELNQAVEEANRNIAAFEELLTSERLRLTEVSGDEKTAVENRIEDIKLKIIQAKRSKAAAIRELVARGEIDEYDEEFDLEDDELERGMAR